MIHRQLSRFTTGGISPVVATFKSTPPRIVLI